MKTLRAGFTTVRNLGDDHGLTFSLREAIKRGWVQGPRIVDAAQSISTTGGHMDGRGALNDDLVAHWMPSPENLCDSVESCRRVVRRQIDRGADVIKFATTGGVNSGTGLATRMFEDEAKALVDTAHAYGRKVAVHAHGADGIKLALRAGADSIEHGTVMDDEIIRLMKAKGTYYVPTLSTVNGYLERLAKDPNAYTGAVRQQIDWRRTLKTMATTSLPVSWVHLTCATCSRDLDTSTLRTTCCYRKLTLHGCIPSKWVQRPSGNDGMA